MQKIVYQNVKKLFKQHNKNLDELIGKCHSEILDEDGFGTANRQHKNQQSLNDIIKKNKIKATKSRRIICGKIQKSKRKKKCGKEKFYLLLWKIIRSALS